MHRLGVVHDLLGVQDVEILLEELSDRHPLRPIGLGASGGDVLGVHPLTRLGHHRADFGGEGAGAERPVQAVGQVTRWVSSR